jgi:hypothetical protein
MHWDKYNKGNVTEKRVDEGRVEGEMEDKNSRYALSRYCEGERLTYETEAIPLGVTMFACRRQASPVQLV